MACEFAAVYSQYRDATTVTCRGFQAYRPGTLLPPRFVLGSYEIVARCKAALVVVPGCGELPAGLQFEGQGIQVNLPSPTVAVTIQAGSWQRQPLAVVALDRRGQQVDRCVIPGGGALYTVTLVGTELDSLLLVGGGDGGRLVQICGASSSMQTLLEDYFDPCAQPAGLLPYLEAARRLFAGYYLRPQEVILQGRLGSSDGIATLCSQGMIYDYSHSVLPALHRPHLGYDGLYTHVGSGLERTCLSPNWRVIRHVALALPLTVAAPALLARVARGAGVAVAEIATREWVMKKAVAALIEIGFPRKSAALALPYLTDGTELAAAWLLCADVPG
ncbi:MAG: hypothetical protein IT328_11750 [Caldilineaceae bacterium]|nr:hypothetical protein [Caldilineaceae bacterium]